VFRGGFTAEAAEAVAGASLRVLTRLADTSFVRVDSVGRYDIHELLRQFAVDQLGSDPATQERAVDHHCHYYARFVANRVYQIAYGDAQEVIVEIDNLRAAWSRAIEEHKLAQIVDMTEGLSFLYPDRMGLLEESRVQFERAATALATDDPAGEQGIVYGQVLTAQGIAEWDCGHEEKARTLMHTGIDILRRMDAPKPVMAASLCFGSVAADDLAAKEQITEEFMAIARELGEEWRIAHGLNQLGFIYFFHSHFEQGRSCGQQLLTTAQKIGNSILMGLAHLLLGEIAITVDDHKTARQHLEEAVQFFGNFYPLRRTRCLWLLGVVEWAQGRYDNAERYYQENLQFLARIGLENFSIAHNLIGLALVAQARGNHAEAQRLAGECLTVWQELENLEGIAGTLVTMGYLAAQRGDTEEAIQHYAEALDKGREAGLRAITLEVVMGFANLAARAGKMKRATEILALGFAHEWDTFGGLERKPLYWQLRDDLEAEMDAATFKTAWERGEKLDLDATAHQLLTPYSSEDTIAMQAANQRLEEPLTARELEVLGLLAQGRSNRQIADTLVIAVGTVKRYVYTICQKLHADNRTQAVINAQCLNLL